MKKYFNVVYFVSLLFAMALFILPWYTTKPLLPTDNIRYIGFPVSVYREGGMCAFDGPGIGGHSVCNSQWFSLGEIAVDFLFVFLTPLLISYLWVMVKNKNIKLPSK